MSNPDRRPDITEYAGADPAGADPAGADRAQIAVISPREVPLGGLRAMTVRRTLPSRQRTLIGAWCFVDHYGPDDVTQTGGMSVAPHPHTGLQTVSWLFAGQIQHRDSIGTVAMVRPGEVNLMTGGHGISHSEVSTQATTSLHGAQLWVALPDHAREVAPRFQHHAPAPINGDGWTASVFLGSLLGETSPVATHTPLLGAQLDLAAGAVFVADIEPTFEHGVLVDAGVVEIAGRRVEPAELIYLPPGGVRLRIEAVEGPVRLLLLGGPPFGEQIVMWWNFIGRDHDEIVAQREAWQAQITRDGVVVADSQQVADGRFGVVAGDHLPPIPAPALPVGVRLRSRG